MKKNTIGVPVSTFTVRDGADEFRIEIVGKFAGTCVYEVEKCWREALAQTLSRTVTVDISRVSESEHAGRRLLQHMHQHGTKIAAATPRSLVLLNEVTAVPRRGPAPALVPHAPTSENRREQLKPRTKAAGAGAG